MKENQCIRVFAAQQQIERCQQRVEQVSPSVTGLSNALGLAGNEVRLNILFLLDEEAELCVCDLSDILGMKISAISQHLRKLKDGKIVQTKKIGQTVFYRLSPEYAGLFRPFFAMIADNKTIAVS
ncbi:ArsR/SmtB family transcription factor [Tunicatimonas pelagia]|uniref:ArsR/SmtB family transcription factor n=1 Tax=Tunicatimonas pelagia TaxID=931531 RepID=UPI0026660F58|nr:metalloregulator ArsR/SmtB family transcription factor [Tunicatimonas pelagia]WKN45368.1 metalloregulator ArsR/SmtB family transcription factor [Tunicatimonas pelagia]